MTTALDEQLAKQHPRTRVQVNNFIKHHRGIDPDLVKGKGYFYFAQLIPFVSSVYVNSVSQMSYASWLQEYDALAEDRNV